jgi:hypothetical protein
MKRTLVALAIAAVAALAGGCSVIGGTGGTPSPTTGPTLTTAELRYRLIESFGPAWFCDPDFYPVARFDEQQRAIERFGEMQADSDAFDAILAHLGIQPGADVTDQQKLDIYRAWKQLNAIVLDPAGADRYRFDYLNIPVPGANDGRRTTGTIDAQGTITIEQQAPAGEPPCPICLARGTRIATPNGDVAVEDVRVGLRVWSFDVAGRRVVASVIRTGRTPVPDSHEVVRLVLDDGRVLRASPGHPLPDGRPLESIRARDIVDAAIVTSATLEPYDGGFTHDLLTDSPTGGYIADDIPLRSTLTSD